MNWQRDEFTITDDRASLDIPLIHDFLRTSYWAKGIPKEIVVKALENSLCFGVFHQSRQVGFGRVVTDRATFAYLADVFVIESYRGRGIGKWLVACVREHPELQGLRRWLLATADAHQLYRQHGFAPLGKPDRMMEIVDPEIYLRKS
ncbi:MAG: GNAT family N-acetyltransferase [Betaproteobacteria bacterium]|nr:GNAT family N-acetyltransferase [Betaproteobacteria bacterium]